MLPVQEADSGGSGWSQPSVPVSSDFDEAATKQDKIESVEVATLGLLRNNQSRSTVEN